MAITMSCFGGNNKLLIHLQLLQFQPSSSAAAAARTMCKPLPCTPLQEQVDGGILCEPVRGRGWLLCEFCRGQKTNVKAENNRIYRRCPSCRAVGYILCSKCKVFKCVTFPNYTDGEDLTYGS